MSFTAITTDEITEGRAAVASLYSKVNDNFADHESRIRELEIDAAPVPIGSIVMYPAASAPTGYLVCDGSAVSRTTYADLFSVIGTRFGSGDGSSTFNVPNKARRTLVGSGGSGTADLGSTVGSTGGEESHALTSAEMPVHSHTGTTGNNSDVHTHSVSGTVDSGGSAHVHDIEWGTHADNSFADDDAYTPTTGPRLFAGTSSNTHTHSVSASTSAASGAAHTYTTAASGSGTAHNNVMPSLVLNFIIKT